jgi:hypothetical protein
LNILLPFSTPDVETSRIGRQFVVSGWYARRSYTWVVAIVVIGGSRVGRAVGSLTRSGLVGDIGGSIGRGSGDIGRLEGWRRSPGRSIRCLEIRLLRIVEPYGLSVNRREKLKKFHTHCHLLLACLPTCH